LAIARGHFAGAGTGSLRSGFTPRRALADCAPESESIRRTIPVN